MHALKLVAYPSAGKGLLHLATAHSISGEPRPSGPCDSFNVVSPTSARSPARPALVTGPPVQDSLVPPVIFRARHMIRPSLFQFARQLTVVFFLIAAFLWRSLNLKPSILRSAAL
ncbi:jg26656 [Pararge aegeria aegeria]|uniref:Jg26656 protein n=1 Tax=Pararge aegeria aegeria TaxID=348720 RepID=A0A8S4QQ55_9NEOP|nr:jg26656 [Pararge aegeria aegeria]